MSTVRIALANLPYPATPDESVVLAEEAIAQAALERREEMAQCLLVVPDVGA